MWQMTWDELETDSFRPKRYLMHIGSWGYDCPICGEAVGIFRTDEYGWIYKREACANGHKINWSEE